MESNLDGKLEIDGKLSVLTSYQGNRLLEGFATKYSLPLDHVNFMATQLMAVVLATIYGLFFRPHPGTRLIRLWYLLIVGIGLGIFAFGVQAIHLFLLPCLCYIPLRASSPQTMPSIILVVAMGYLSCIHIHRMILGEDVSLDITGPLMVITQKITALAYCLKDGNEPVQAKLNSTQKTYAIMDRPTLLEYFSYLFQFQSLMAGPFVTYKDFKDFLSGRNIKKYEDVMMRDLSDPSLYVEPSPYIPALKKIIISILCALTFKMVHCPINRLKETSFLEQSLVYQMSYIILATSIARFKYYHAWIMADAVCNLSGLGFNGYDPVTKQPNWDLTSNVDIFKFELGTNLHVSIENWNRGTNLWLKLVVYRRIKKYPVLFTYLLSAIWHGFYPGYYITFLSGAMFTIAARTVRAHLRPRFQSSTNMKALYDLITMLVTRLVIGYITFSFVILEFWASILVFWHMYFWLHFLGLMTIFFLPRFLGQSEAPLRNKLTKLVANSNGVNTLHG